MRTTYGIDQKTAEKTVLMLMQEHLYRVETILMEADIQQLAAREGVPQSALSSDKAAVLKELRRQREILDNKLIFVRRR